MDLEPESSLLFGSAVVGENHLAPKYRGVTRLYAHAAEFWQERRVDDAVVGGRVRPAKGARSCHQNERLRKSTFKVELLR